LLQREKSRDLFDFGSIIENKILTLDEIISISSELRNLSSKAQIIDFLSKKKESKDDESVYLNEKDRLNLSFDEIKEKTIKLLNK
jgi:hypothetical protein